MDLVKKLWQDNPAAIISQIVVVIGLVLNSWFLIRIQPLEAKVARIEDNLATLQNSVRDIQTSGTTKDQINAVRIDNVESNFSVIQASLIRLERKVDSLK